MQHTNMKTTLNALLVALLTTTGIAIAAEHQHAGHGAPAAAPAAAATTATGVVKKIDAQKLTASIQHDPIPALKWPTMTMVFKLQDKKVADALAPEKKITFDFVQQGKDYVVTAVR